MIFEFICRRRAGFIQAVFPVIHIFIEKRNCRRNDIVVVKLDGMAFSKYAGALNSGGATGYGVRLLNKFIEENYE